MAYFYEAGAVSVNWSGVDLSEGWAADTFLTITPNSDRVEFTAGAGGQGTFSKIADKSCTITMVFQDVATVNKKISALSGAQDAIGASLPVAPFTVIDKTGKSVHFAALNAVLTAVPEISFGRASGERTWTWVCESYIMAEDPATITAALADYLPAGTNA